jgi:membrane-bound lytic murein transglycosylase F
MAGAELWENSGPTRTVNTNLKRLRTSAWWRLLVVLVAMLALAGCGRPLSPPGESGELVMLTRQSMATYYLGVDRKPTGFEYDLARLFAERQGWRLRPNPAVTLGRLFAKLENGEGHLAAAGLGITPARQEKFLFGPVYGVERELVVCGPGVTVPTDKAGLAGLRLEVVAGSSHLERLHELRGEVPGLQWREVRAASEEELLERVADGVTDCAVADSVSFDVAWNFLPGLRVALELGTPREIAWALPKTADPALIEALKQFFDEIHRNGVLDDLRERYFGHVRHLAEADVLGLLERRERLRALKPHFIAAQDVTGLDWRFLAALAYQESQWNPAAVSPTGVRGIMMLTVQTADHLGVRNRLDPEESILGGARYMIELKEALPAGVGEPDRTWIALAAYNIGPSHLEDARRLARRLRKNPDSWRDMKQVLPLIARPQYAKWLRNGYARGGEARTLVENVRIYYDILLRYESAHSFSLGRR